MTTLLRAIFVSLLCCCSSFLSAEEGDGYQFKGTHFIASYSECDRDALCDVEGLIETMTRAAKECGATILQSSHYLFPPHGLTMVILLSESHASIHTYPEHGACFVDLFTCGEKCSSEKFDAVLQEFLKPNKIDQRLLIRNEGIAEQS